MSERRARGLLRGIEYAVERIAEAEARGDYLAAIRWAEARDRVATVLRRR